MQDTLYIHCGLTTQRRPKSKSPDTLTGFMCFVEILIIKAFISKATQPINTATYILILNTYSLLMGSLRLHINDYRKSLSCRYTCLGTVVTVAAVHLSL